MASSWRETSPERRRLPGKRRCGRGSASVSASSSTSSAYYSAWPMASRVRWLVAAGLAVAALIVYRFDPSLFGFYPRCVFHAITGLECPGCGGTRALHGLLHGRLAPADPPHTMLVFVMPFVVR